MSYVLTQYFVSCVNVRFYFSLPLIFTLPAASIFIFFPPLWISMFFFLRNSSPLFSITRSSSLYCIERLNSLNTLTEHKQSTSTWFGLTEQRDRGHVTPNKFPGPHIPPPQVPKQYVASRLELNVHGGRRGPSVITLWWSSVPYWISSHRGGRD